ncbi:MAG: amidohydrolase family protein, partial [Firmicutes bacterium]|nr:amidohydrolase family protein [Bacillota bacterium]
LSACRKRDGDRLAGLFGLHASFTLSDRTLARCAERIDPRDGYHLHVAEGALDARDAMDNHRLQVLERLDRFSILRPNTIAVHCISVTDEGIDLLRARGTSVAHNPQSNMNNAVGCARVLRMAGKGVRVGIGTDGYTSDVLESYKVAPILQRHEAKDPSVGFTETAQMLLGGNAAIAAKSFPRPLGVLREGACGDVVIVDYDPPTPLTADNQIGHILFGLTGRMVDTTIVAGRVLMRERQIQTVDSQAVTAKARETAKRLWARV